MLEKERPQIVSVAPRWLDAHYPMVMACAEYGCHVLLEKPMAQDLRQANEMIAAFEAKHLKMAVAHQARHSPRIARVRELIADGKLGDLLEIRGRGKEDHRGGGEDLIVLGTHIMDLMRLLAGPARWCFARVLEKGEPITAADVREGGEAVGPIAGDEIHATYGFRSPTIGSFDTYRAREHAGQRWGLRLFGSKGMITISNGAMPSFPEVHFIEDPAWAPGQGKAEWIPITGGGLGKPETAPEVSPQTPGNILIVKDLLRAIETDTQPNGGMYDARASLEMILATYESQRVNAPVALPLGTREHPLRLLK